MMGLQFMGGSPSYRSKTAHGQVDRRNEASAAEPLASIDGISLRLVEPSGRCFIQRIRHCLLHRHRPAFGP
jgi:hypothetical protein